MRSYSRGIVCTLEMGLHRSLSDPKLALSSGPQGAQESDSVPRTATLALDADDAVTHSLYASIACELGSYLLSLLSRRCYRRHRRL